MLTLINTNRMTPPIAPIGLDYVAGVARRDGVEVDLLDLCLLDDPAAAISSHLADKTPDLIGLSFRNVDDCFWPSGQSFVDELVETVRHIRRHADAPIVAGGVGFSIFASRLVELADIEFGVHGDGEGAVGRLLAELRGSRRFDRVPGLVWRDGGRRIANRPAWPEELALPTDRSTVDNSAYFRLGGQAGIETKRGCPRRCLYCADPVAKGHGLRLRAAGDVADEFESLLARGIDVVHLCDGEFNVPRQHAVEVCDELIRRGLGARVRWYAYLTVVPFDRELAGRMRRAGCVGINFTSDSAAERMLARYGHPHRSRDIAAAVGACRDVGITVMLDLLLGGPGETPETLAESIRFFKSVEPDCVGAGVGVRIYPNTGMAEVLAAEGPPEANPNIHRHYAGPIDLLQPTYYISAALGERAARRVRDLIAGDERFFEPADPAEFHRERSDGEGDHNYNDNRALTDAIAGGARGAYWDLLRQIRDGT